MNRHAEEDIQLADRLNNTLHENKYRHQGAWLKNDYAWTH